MRVHIPEFSIIGHLQFFLQKYIYRLMLNEVHQPLNEVFKSDRMLIFFFDHIFLYHPVPVDIYPKKKKKSTYFHALILTANFFTRKKSISICAIRFVVKWVGELLRVSLCCKTLKFRYFFQENKQ